MTVKGRASDGSPVPLGDVHVYSPSQVKAVPVNEAGEFGRWITAGWALPWFRGDRFLLPTIQMPTGPSGFPQALKRGWWMKLC